jgi:hypothetical protein
MEFILVAHKDETSLPLNIFYNTQTYKYQGILYSAIIYEVHYNDNLSIGVGGLFPRNKLLGYHEGDIERVIILTDADSIPHYVFLSAHAQEGRWYPYSAIEKQDNIPIIYVAKGSHSMNNSNKSRVRLLGFANDVFSPKNKGKIIKITPTKDTNISYNIWENEVLSTPIRALLYPMYAPILDQLKARQRIANEESQK